MLDIDAIIFDIDGTLVDSRDDIVAAVNYTLKAVGLPEKPFDLIVSYIGTGVRDLVTKNLGGGHVDLYDKALAVYSAYFLNHAADRSVLYPHVVQTLDYFKGKRKFVITNRDRMPADMTLSKLGIRGYFEQILGGDGGLCLKPSACGLERLSSEFSIPKDKMLIIGDMDIDIMTGKAFGITTCWVSYGLGKSGDVLKLKPDYVLDDIGSLKDIIR